MFAQNVTMNTKYVNISTYERRIYAAFACGCVRQVDTKAAAAAKCPVHGETLVSVTEELVPVPRPAMAANY